MKTLFTTLLLTVLAAGSAFAANIAMNDWNAAFNAKDQAKMEQWVKENKQNAIQGTYDLKKRNYLYALIHTDFYGANKTITVDNFDTKISELITELKFTKDINVIKLHAMTMFYWLNVKDSATKATKTKILNKILQFIETNYDELKGRVNAGLMYRENGNFEKAFEIFKNSGKDGGYYIFGLIDITNLTDSQIKEAIDCLIKNQSSINIPQRLDAITSIIERKLIDPKYDSDVKRLLLILNRSHYSKIGISDSWKASIVKLQLLMKSYNL